MKRQNLRTVALIVVTLTYLLIGAAIFGYLESDHEVSQREALELIEQIVKRKYNISDDDFAVLTTTVIKSVPHKAGIQWKFSGAFYFATTVVTTIGYGHSTPATMAGRSFCMVYALIGIPLGLVMFQSIGERLNTFVGCALRVAKRCFNAKNPEVTQTNLVMVVSVLSTILMTSMAAVFAEYERWEYFDALYYCFITLTTIGFGDYVALQKESALQSKPEYVALSLIFILFGLSVVSSAVNLLVLKFLTLNTEDERRDEQLRYTASLNPIQLEGDVITSGRRPKPFPDQTDKTQTNVRSTRRDSQESVVLTSGADLRYRRSKHLDHAGQYRQYLPQDVSSRSLNMRLSSSQFVDDEYESMDLDETRSREAIQTAESTNQSEDELSYPTSLQSSSHHSKRYSSGQRPPSSSPNLLLHQQLQNPKNHYHWSSTKCHHHHRCKKHRHHPSRPTQTSDLYGHIAALDHLDHLDHPELASTPSRQSLVGQNQSTLPSTSNQLATPPDDCQVHRHRRHHRHHHRHSAQHSSTCPLRAARMSHPNVAYNERMELDSRNQTVE